MSRPALIISLILAIWCHGHTQVDSLENALLDAAADSTRVRIHLELFQAYRYDDPAKAALSIQEAIGIAAGLDDRTYHVIALNTLAGALNSRAENDSAIAIFNQALAISEDITYTAGRLDALEGLGKCYLGKGDFKKAEDHLNRHIPLATDHGDLEGVANSYNSLGNIHNEKGEYKQAMIAYTEAAKLNTEIGNVRNAGINNANIGLIHQKLENYDKAISYYTTSDSLFREFEFMLGQAFVLKNMGIVYRHQGKHDEALAKYNSALDLYEKLDSRRDIGQVYQNIGNIYSDIEEPDKAIENYRVALSITTDLSDSVTMAMTYQSMGLEFLRINALDSAALYSGTALKIASAVGADLTVMDSYKTLGEIYEAKGDYRRAYSNMTGYQLMRDSLYTIEKRDLAEEIEAKYQNEQKTQEIALLDSEKELQALQLTKRKNERNAAIIFTLFILLLAGLLYRQYLIKQRANAKLRELDHLKSNFFANISHEFRTPLTLIKGPITRLEQDPENTLSKDEVQMIRRNTNKVLSLVNQLLDLSRIDQGKLKLKPTEGDVFKCLKTAAASFNSHAAQRDMDYQVDIPNSSFWAAFDREKLEQIVYNLLSNAFKFSDDGERIAFQASYVDDRLVIRVSDTGSGIEEEKLPYIFDRFYQADDSSTKEHEGSGIGLSLSKDLVELMDGTIAATSEKGKGTEFEVHIPIEKIKTPGVTVGQTEERELKETALSGPATIIRSDNRKVPEVLLVEDNADMRQFISSILSESYRITEAKNGDEGMRKATANAPDLIITDLMMPKMDGMTLCKQLKTQLATSHIPVIMLTARAGLESKIEGLETGADDYIVKPFEARELTVRVKNLIDQRERLAMHYRENEHRIDPAKVTTTSLDRRFLEQVLSLLEERHGDPDFGVPEMQKALALSKTQLHRKLKSLTGESPGQLLRNFRLKRAAQLLSQKADTVTQIAYQVGFSNLSYFAKCFKAEFGVSPSSY